MSGAGDGVGSRRGQLVGAQGVLSAGWLVYAKAAKNGTVVESELLFYKVTYPALTWRFLVLTGLSPQSS